MKNATKEKKSNTLVGGIAGAALGASGGISAGSGKLALGLGAAGAGILGGISYAMGKHNEKKIHNESNQEINKYKKSSEEDKQVLRRRLDRMYKDDSDRRTRNAVWQAALLR